MTEKLNEAHDETTSEEELEIEKDTSHAPNSSDKSDSDIPRKVGPDDLLSIEWFETEKRFLLPPDFPGMSFQ